MIPNKITVYTVSQSNKYNEEASRHGKKCKVPKILRLESNTSSLNFIYNL